MKNSKLIIAAIFAALAVFALYKFISAPGKADLITGKQNLQTVENQGGLSENEPTTQTKTTTYTQTTYVPGTNNVLVVNPQKPGPLANIARAVLDQNGFVAIHEDNRGEPGRILATSPLLLKGEHLNVPIAIDMAPAAGYIAMLHADSNGDRTFTPNYDLPLRDNQGVIVMTEFYATQSATTSGKSYTIELKNFEFNPKNLTVKRGDLITFKNSDIAQHTVSTAAFGGQRVLKPGDLFTVDTTTLSAGTYNYNCDFHPNMTGVLTVGL